MSADDHRDSDLEVSEIAQLLVDTLGGTVQWHGDTDITVREQLNVHLKSPLPERVRFCLFNLIFSSREEEYKINARLPEDDRTDRYAPDRSDGCMVLIGGYNEQADIWTFWDDSLRDTYSSNPSIQIDEETIDVAEENGFAVQDKDRGGSGGETVVAAEPDQLDEAIDFRYRTIRNRRILNELLYDDWRGSGARAQVVERIVDIVIEETDYERPMSERRRDAVRKVANERGNSPSTVKRKLRSDLFPDRSRGSDGYIETHFDPLLREVEEAVRAERLEVKSALFDYIENVETETSIHIVSLPPEDWIVSCYYNAIPFSDSEQSQYQSIEKGDIVLFHLNDESDILDSGSYESGIIGGAIIAKQAEKDEDRWYAEWEGSEEYLYIVRFQRVFYCGSSSKIDLTTEIQEKEVTDIERETRYLTQNLFSEDRADEILATDFPPSEKHKEIENGSERIDLGPTRDLVKRLALRLTEAPSVNIHAPYDGSLDDEDLFEGLYLPGQKNDIKAQVNSALRTGKHIIFTGPPGTGKTEIASNIAEELEKQYPWQFSGSQITTATSDWSTFDTLGGYMPEEGIGGGDQLSFSSGILLNRLKDDYSMEQRNEPVVIDELNRSNIDEAFGQLFTVLSGESVQLQHTRDGKELEIVTADSLDRLPGNNQYVVPSSWRILATMNTFDKNSLYEMSYAFMRRFSFISVNDPFQEDSYHEEDDLLELMNGYDNEWETGSNEDKKLSVGKVWRGTNQAVEGRSIGPAIVKDMLEGVVEMTSAGQNIDDALTHAVMNYIFPQLEGVRGRKTVVNNIIDTGEVHKKMVRDAAVDRLDVDFEDEDDE
jgi:MoxR-like ATPase